ncbi:hypothetical protein IK5_06025 [Bacillus cereus VD154]|uniref:Uncharacterized protein n=1 Tax=Bacillus cereus VD154 TaxID=1053238 RepID=A0A9W5KQW2_BACCE|nr:hypothetical protein IK5_06025 [Bacillus cereus VD154]
MEKTMMVGTTNMMMNNMMTSTMSMMKATKEKCC